MPIRLANNASARLAAPLANTDTTVVLLMDDIQHFPGLAAGEWHPLTIVAASGESEIVRVTSRDANLLTVVRAQEGTLSLNFDTGSRAEVRLTAGAINAIQDETEQYVDAAVDGEATARQTAISGERTTSADEIDALRSELLSALTLPTGCMMPWSLPTEPVGWIFANGRTLFVNSGYPALRTAYINAGFPFGQDGSGNPTVPDMRGRTAAGLDNMGAGAAGRLTGAALGAALGAQTHALTAAEMPTHAHGVTDPTHAHSVSDPTHAHSVYDPGHAHTYDRYSASGANTQTAGTNQARNPVLTATSAVGTGIAIYGAATGIGIYASGTGISIQNAGSNGAHNNVQPTLATQYIVKT